MGIITQAVDQSAVARVLGIETLFQDLRAGQVTFLPQRVVLLGQGATASTYSLDKRQVTSALEVGETYGFGSPLHLAALQLLPVNGGGLGTVPLTILPLADDASGTTADGDISGVGTMNSTQSYRIRINNILSNPFTIAEGGAYDSPKSVEVAAAINAVLEMPVTAVDNAGTTELTSKWEGESANDLVVEIVGEVDGITFAVTQPVGGTNNPDTASALAQIGGVWESVGINCLNISDTTTLDDLQTFGEGRWGSLVRKPMVWFTGNTEADVATSITVPDARKSDRINSQLVEPGSNDLPFVVAAAQAAQIAVQANNNPPTDYGSTPAPTLTPGADGVQWNYLQRDTAVKGGSSTIEVKDGVVNLSDIVTFYHPTGDTTPAYRYVVDIMKLMNIIFNIDIIFAGKPWDGAPLILDEEPTSNPNARKPKDAKAALATLTDNLGLQAIVTDVAATKRAIEVAINSQNPKRLDACYPVKLSGNANIISVDLKFAFFFG